MKKMKKIIYTSIISISILLATSCVDLDIVPVGDMVLEDFWQNESQVNQVMSACYRSMTESAFMDKMLVWGELRSDNVTFGSGTPTDMYKMINIDITPTNGYCKWGSIYTTINYCNNFLHYAPDVLDLDPNLTTSELRAMEAEVLSIRALAYFYLVRTFKDVPWNDVASIDDKQEYAIETSTEDFVLDKIVEDLNTALIYARDKFDITKQNKGRITKNAIRAILADIYLWSEEYTKCINMCDQILVDEEQGLELETGENVLTQIFGVGNSSESIFELQFDDETMVNNTVSSFYGSYGNEEGFWSFPSVLVTGDASPFNYKSGTNIESENDLRLKDFLNPENSGDKYYVFKYAGYSRYENLTTGRSSYNYRILTANWIVYRLSEIYLMKAEALIQLETNMQEALDLINVTYMRSNTDPATQELELANYNTKLDMENLLLRERQRELMFEGKRWFDLMRIARRTDSPSSLLSYVVKKYAGTSNSQLSKMSVMDALYLPIHTDELKANPSLEQNEFYKLNAEGYNNE